jgi:hypothetical protein
MAKLIVSIIIGLIGLVGSIVSAYIAANSATETAIVAEQQRTSSGTIVARIGRTFTPSSKGLA